jgi:tetratricopeptide (TPR) repeat protein
MSPSIYKPEGMSEALTLVWRGGPEANKVKEIRRQLKENPDTLSLRLVLLNYLEDFTRRRNNRELFIENFIWLIDHKPRHYVHAHGAPHFFEIDDDYRKAKTHWLRVVKNNPDDVTVMYHAACFLDFLDPLTAAPLLLRAGELDPTDDQFPYSLAKAYRFHSLRVGLRTARKYARMAVEQIRRAVDCYQNSEPSNERSYFATYYWMHLEELATVTLMFGLLEETEELANLLLKEKEILQSKLGHAPERLRSTMIANAVLAKVAIARGEVERARALVKQLIAVRYQLDSDLASDLVNCGETLLACEYLESHQCEENREWVRKTVGQIKRGQRPRIGQNRR